MNMNKLKTEIEELKNIIIQKDKEINKITIECDNLKLQKEKLEKYNSDIKGIMETMVKNAVKDIMESSNIVNEIKETTKEASLNSSQRARKKYYEKKKEQMKLLKEQHSTK
jgi:hypothetical protein